MRITITARHFRLSDELKNFAEKEVYRLKKYYDGIIDVEIILNWEKKYRLAEIKISVYGTVLSAHVRSEEMSKSIVLAVDKLERQIKKYKERLKGFGHAKIGIAQFEQENGVMLENKGV